MQRVEITTVSLEGEDNDGSGEAIAQVERVAAQLDVAETGTATKGVEDVWLVEEVTPRQSGPTSRMHIHGTPALPARGTRTFFQEPEEEESDDEEESAPNLFFGTFILAEPEEKPFTSIFAKSNGFFGPPAPTGTIFDTARPAAPRPAEKVEIFDKLASPKTGASSPSPSGGIFGTLAASSPKTTGEASPSPSGGIFGTLASSPKTTAFTATPAEASASAGGLFSSPAPVFAEDTTKDAAAAAEEDDIEQELFVIPGWTPSVTLEV